MTTTRVKFPREVFVWAAVDGDGMLLASRSIDEPALAGQTIRAARYTLVDEGVIVAPPEYTPVHRGKRGRR